MIGTVEDISKTQTGKPKVKISGQWCYPGRLPYEEMKVGQRIEYFLSPFKLPSGVVLQMIESWAPEMPPLPSALPEGHKYVGLSKPAQNGSNGATTHSYDDAQMRFISNVVGSACASGACKAPSEVVGWALSARAALLAIVKPVEDFDDEVPM